MQQLDLDAELAALCDLELAEMRLRWIDVTGNQPPKVRASLLRLALASELQAAQLGALPRTVAQQLEQVGCGQQTAATALPGTRLTREWRGVLHTVRIEADGTISWNERKWRSLSEVARAITGSRWSGPVFFGLKKGKVA